MDVGSPTGTGFLRNYLHCFWFTFQNKKMGGGGGEGEGISSYICEIEENGIRSKMIKKDKHHSYDIGC